jgi:hypothetical protein
MTLAGELPEQRKSDDGVAMLPGRGFCLRCQFCFQNIRFEAHFARGNFFVAGAVIAELADAKTFLGPHRRPKYAACHGTSRVQIACARLRVEHWTRLIVGKVGKSLLRFRRIIEDAGLRIAGEIKADSRDRELHTTPHARSTFRIFLFQLLKAVAEAFRVKLADRKRSYATLCASRTTDEPLAAAASGIGQRGIDDLYKLLIIRWEHFSSIGQKGAQRAAR